jgi:hypothetical protein
MRKTVLIPMIALMLAFSACTAGTENNPPPQNQTGQSATTRQEKTNYINAGMYKVGQDLKAGEYLLYSNGGFAYYQVSKDSTGSLDSIISNDNFTNTRYITVEDGQYIEFRDAKMLPSSEAQPQQPVDGKYPSGMYKTGKDIKAGEYKVSADSGQSAYIEVRKSSKGRLDEIVSNDNFTGEKYITVSEGQYLTMNNCSILAKG